MKHPHVLVVSPIPSHPQDQGNSARIFTVAKMLQSIGCIIHFLYYQMEGLSENQRSQMEQCWDYFHPVPTMDFDTSPSHGLLYALDDWWPAALESVVNDLHRRWHFSTVVVNYVWFSKVLDVFGGGVLKVLDTHDMFGGRADRFRSSGLEPEWYYTSIEEEQRGFRRADIVIAIQQEEAELFRSGGHPGVMVLGHMLPMRRRKPQVQNTRPVVCGYIASGNPINMSSFDRMVDAIRVREASDKRFIVAGSICRKLTGDLGPFEPLGYIDHLDDFYDKIDLVLNPMTFGTGLKIKSVEALYEGLPIIATKSAMLGLPVGHPLHILASPREVAEAALGMRTEELTDLWRASRDCAVEYAASVRAEAKRITDLVLR